MAQIEYTIKLRRDTATNWTSNNTVLAEGEFGYEKDTGKLKIGDGETAWASLPYGVVIPEDLGSPTGTGSFVRGTSPTITTPSLSGLTDAVDDTAAAIAGVAVGKIYRTGSILKIRVS